MTFDWQMPRDPFADDPNDPASFLEEDEPMPPLSAQERAQIEHDLMLVTQFRAVLAPQGVAGIFIECADCEEIHYYDWDILAARIRANLAGEGTLAHEPSTNPNPEAYVPWDYCLGYIDGMNTPWI